MGAGLLCEGGGGAWARTGTAGDAGAEFRAGGGGGVARLLSALRTGGFGRLSVVRPVVSVLYGRGGPLGFSSGGCCGSCFHLGVGTGLPSPPAGGRDLVGEVGVPALLPIALECFGGGPKLSGSLKDAKGTL